MTHPADGTKPVVSIIIPCFNKWDYTIRCLQKLVENTRGVPFETIVIDNASADDTRIGLPMLEGIRLHRNEVNLGFAKACNQGAEMARGKYLLFLNNDTEPQPGWLTAMIRLPEADASIAVVGSKLLFPDGTLQHAGVGFLYASPHPISPVHLNYRLPPERANEFLELKCVTGASLLIRREIFFEVGRFDEGYVNGNEDVDLCLKVHEKKGRIIFTPESVLIHHESVSEGRFSHVNQNVNLFHERWLRKFSAFDYDFRLNPPPFQVDVHRPPASVVMVTHNSLHSVSPCIENVLLSMGPQDELIVLDNASVDCTALYLEVFSERNRERVKFLKLPEKVSTTAAIQKVLAEARHDMVALAAPYLKPSALWLEKAIAHLRVESDVGLVGAVGNHSPVPPTGVFAPEPDTGRLVERPKLSPMRALERNFVIGNKAVFVELANQQPTVFEGPPERYRQALKKRGLQLMGAPDVQVRQMGLATEGWY
jgi:GT2 family glycosyltransferase